MESLKDNMEPHDEHKDQGHIGVAPPRERPAAELSQIQQSAARESHRINGTSTLLAYTG